MGRILAIAIWLVTLATLVVFASGRWSFPAPASAHGLLIDRQFNVTWVIVAVGFALAQIALGFVVWRYPRGKRGRAFYTTGNARVEVICAAITAIVFVSLAIFGQTVWAELHLRDAPADAVLVEVTGQQFVWNFRYPGADGKFGGSRPELYNDEDNAATARPGPLGIDPKDPLGLDDLVSVGLMVVPVNRPVKLILRAKDVTHSFFVPALRFKQDAVPGLRINVHFTPIREGRYEIACAELCGISHHRMRAFLEVRSQSEFEKWLQEKASQ